MTYLVSLSNLNPPQLPVKKGHFRFPVAKKMLFALWLFYGKTILWHFSPLLVILCKKLLPIT